MLSDFKDYWIENFRGANKARVDVDYERPIPVGRSMEKGKWKAAVTVDKTDPLFNDPIVPLGIFTEEYTGTYCPEIFTHGVYFGESNYSPYKAVELDGSLLTSFVRKAVAQKLAQASKTLPEGYAFITLDTLRTKEVQSSLFEYCKAQYIAPPYNFSSEEAEEKTQKYVSRPDPEHAPHLSGGAVDITLVKFDPESWKKLSVLTRKLKKIAPDRTRWDEVYAIEMQRYQILRQKGKMVNMGVAFDQVAFDAKDNDMTALRYYEEKLEKEGSLSPEDSEILKNRRMLYNVMSGVGFAAYPDEPWHFDFGNKFWAWQTGRDTSLYGHATLSPENVAFEEIRREHFRGHKRLTELPSKPEMSNPFMRAAYEMAVRVGSIARTNWSYPAHKISPPAIS